MEKYWSMAHLQAYKINPDGKAKLRFLELYFCKME